MCGRDGDRRNRSGVMWGSLGRGGVRWGIWGQR